MSQVITDISKVWDRIFDQKGFLDGEIDLTLKQFELQRGDSEVDNLFKSIENVTDIKDTQIKRLTDAINEKIVEANQQLSEALQVCCQFGDLEEKCNENTIFKDTRSKRKDQWEKVMDEITAQYFKINSEFEEKEIKTTQDYKDLERKLK